MTKTDGSTEGTTYKYAKVAESLREDERNDNPEGTRTIVFGKQTDPNYIVLTDDGPRKITHDVIEVIEAPRRMTKREFTEYIREEVLPLDD